MATYATPNTPLFGNNTGAGVLALPQQSTMQWGNLGQINNNIQGAYTPALSPAQIQQQQLGDLTKIPSQYGTNAHLPSTKGQDTPWGWGGEGGKAATGVSAFSALGGLYLGNEARKLAASDLDFRRGSFEKQYQSQRSLVNDQLFDRQQRREREGGLSDEQARAAADAYVKNRGVQ